MSSMIVNKLAARLDTVSSASLLRRETLAYGHANARVV